MNEELCNIETDIKNKKVNNWSILVKPTHACNLNCQYCYDKPFRDKYGNTKMSFKTIRHILELASKHTRRVQWIWHGGEPTLMGIEWYEKVQELFYEYHDKLIVSQSIQTNGTLLDEKWAELSNDYGIQIGVSYDAFDQEIRLNGQTFKVEESIEKYRSAGGQLGVITVINKTNYKKMKEMYDYFKQSELSVAFNHVYRSSGTVNFDLEMTAEEYAEQYEDFLEYWIYDNSESPIEERTVTGFIGKVAGLDISPMCTNSDCRTGWIGVNPVGEIYPCDRYLPSKYQMGNIMDYDSIESIYKKSNGHKLYSIETQKRFSTHCEDCGYYHYCQGGCNANHIAVAGDATGVDEFSCELFRQEFNRTYDFFRKIDIYNSKFNQFFTNYILDISLIFMKEIKDFLEKKGLGKYLDLQYSNNGKEIFNSQEFKLFRVFNPNRIANPTTGHTDFQQYSLQLDIQYDNTFDFNEIKEERLMLIESFFNANEEKIMRILLQGGK